MIGEAGDVLDSTLQDGEALDLGIDVTAIDVAKKIVKVAGRICDDAENKNNHGD